MSRFNNIAIGESAIGLGYINSISYGGESNIINNQPHNKVKYDEASFKKLKAKDCRIEKAAIKELNGVSVDDLIQLINRVQQLEERITELEMAPNNPLGEQLMLESKAHFEELSNN